MNNLTKGINQRIKELHDGIMTSIIYRSEISYLTERLEGIEFDLVRDAYNKGYKSDETVRSYLDSKGIKNDEYTLGNSSATLDPEILKQKIDYYLNLISGKRLFESIERMVKTFDYSTDYNEAHKEIKTLVNEINIHENIEPINLGKNFSDIIDRLAAENAAEKPTAYYTSSFPSFNEITKGLKPQNMVVVAGAYKQGKTALGVQLILDYGAKGYSVGIINMEMSQVELEDRILGVKTKIPGHLIRNPKNLTRDQLNQISRRYSKAMIGKSIYIDSRALDEYELDEVVREWTQRFGVKIICVDYISLIIPSKTNTNREEIISGYSRMIKNMAKKYNVVFIVLAQLNRSGLDKPESNNMAESIALARDADFIFTIQNPHGRGILTGRVNNENYKFEPNDYIVRLTESRHTASNKKFVIRMLEHGELIEIKNRKHYDI